jgi:hypothetical protein
MHERVLAIPLIRTGARPSAERRALQRRVHRGDLVAVRPGVLVQPEALEGLWPEHRHLLLVRATAPSIRPPVLLSHRTAAAVHGLPFVGAVPERVEATDPRRERTETTALLRVHGDSGESGVPGQWADLPPTKTVDFAGAASTSLVRTLVDVASSTPLLDALPMVDAALRDRRLLPEMLADELANRQRKGTDKATVAVAMGSALSGSAAESVARVVFRQLRTPEPVQQHPFARPGTRTAVVDFWFPEQGVVVEVDGRAKYEDATMLDGRTTADAHWQEKQREDFIRSFPEVRTVVRFTWADLMDPERVRVALVRAGVPCR